eukprot:CAMPEP_0117495590 /NCGR_PEP_ID=MMETSP0784-20121206/20211_1 /TAXON_ID=39447 /ORGANISM="" /LENGTH=36 /DNA_ID= /DNA_START= /DNA_END= /DNA_ORIENTATION=
MTGGASFRGSHTGMRILAKTFMVGSSDKTAGFRQGH